jgi:hypothetical protein
MIQITLVSLYGDKEDELSMLITECQETVKLVLGSAFSPYDIRQVHATIIGLERRIGSSGHNLNFWKHRSRQVEMDFDGFLTFLRGCSQVPFEVQIGGFGDRDYPFVSDPFEKGKENRPYDRMFSIQGNKVVVMGWPLRGQPLKISPATPHEWVHESRVYPPTLDEIRHAAQKFGILHGYHKTRTAVDNDLFFRIGLFDTNAVSPEATGPLLQQVRSKLSGTQRPVIAQITLDDLFVAAYEDSTLPLASTQVWSVGDKRVTGQFIAELYR